MISLGLHHMQYMALYCMEKNFILCTTISQCHLIIDGIFIVSLPIKVKSIKYFKGWTSPLTMQGLYKCMETVFRYQKISLNENKVNISLY